MAKAIRYYNNTFHSTIKCTPSEVEQHRIDHNTIGYRIEHMTYKTLNKRNINHEYYIKNRRKGYIKNYKSIRHKEEPIFIRRNLNNVHVNNIKGPFKFAGPNADILIMTHPTQNLLLLTPITSKLWVINMRIRTKS